MEVVRWAGNGSGGFDIGVSQVVPGGNGNPVPYLGRQGSTIDIDGDGRTDLMWQRVDAKSSPSVTIAIIQANDTYKGAFYGSCSPWPGWDNCIVVSRPLDYNGDGITDLFTLEALNDGGSKGWALVRGKGDGTFSVINQGSSTALENNAPYLLDINGDGKSDIVWDKVDSSGRSKGQRMLWLGKGDGTFVEQTNLNGKDSALIEYMPFSGDFNGDGLVDLFWVKVYSNGISVASQVEGTIGAGELWLGKGDGTFTTVIAGFDSPPVGYVPLITDLNGDGKADILWDKRSGTNTRSQGQRVLWLSDGVTPDILAKVTTGLGASAKIIYKPMTDGTVYTKETSGVDPLVDLLAPTTVVAQVEADNGVGGLLKTGYAYAGAKAHLDGRGFVGFAGMTVTDVQTGLASTTRYRLDFPFVGLVGSETKTLAGKTLNSTRHAYGATPRGGTRYQSILAPKSGGQCRS
jgi:hypothetical protein